MNASVVWDIVSRAKIGWHEAAGRGESASPRGLSQLMRKQP